MKRAWVRMAATLLCLGVVSAAGAAQAAIRVVIDKSEQRMQVYEDGVRLYSWKVSTGRKGYATPSGTFRVQWLDADHYSSKYDWSPMPWSVFFNGDIAIHGTSQTGKLGQVASHGCVRLSPKSAEVFYRLVQRAGKGQVTIRVQA